MTLLEASPKGFVAAGASFTCATMLEPDPPITVCRGKGASRARRPSFTHAALMGQLSPHSLGGVADSTLN
eukprot:CAMPEP_0171134284 /NCGR_PEP_ID=MMETSP0766_2-20121228/127764_1 /TAXON_ID=439317 /ORGANISM="Gambierdiscus australes, Strain CAWD 149" /LENGTH=69 /DNA_ID=CAMNT_0011597719 /DNA_START=86 /DNA_END=295 /DNA_ORIENTATION=+